MCHQVVEEAADGAVLKVARQQYARRWGGNAAAYEHQGLYKTLAGHLFQHETPRRIIDIGCGRGNGLAALKERMPSDATLIGIDENPDCLAAAAELLGLPKPATRLRATRSGRRYTLHVVPNRLAPVQPLMLVQSDLMRPDPELDAIIGGLAPFDAMTLWFSGIHPARQYDALSSQLGAKSDRHLRMATDLAALEFAGEFLRAGGVFQLVMRAAGSDLEACKIAGGESMRALVQHGPFEIANISCFQYREPSDGDRIGVAAQGLDAAQLVTGAVSTIFRRRS